VGDASLIGTTWTLESIGDGEVVSSVLPGGELRLRDGDGFTAQVESRRLGLRSAQDLGLDFHAG